MKFFRCIDCRKFKIKTDKTYEIHVNGDGFELLRYMCNKCGDPFDDVYQQGKKLAESESDE